MMLVFEGKASMTAHCNSFAKFELSGIPPAPCGVPPIEVTGDIDANGVLKKLVRRQGDEQQTQSRKRTTRAILERMVSRGLLRLTITK